MHALLNKNAFLVKEHTGMFKAANNFDIYDPSTQQMVLMCREENLGFLTKILRFSKYKQLTPFEIDIHTAQGAHVMKITRGITLFLSKVEVFDASGELIGYFKQRFFSLGGAFDMYDSQDSHVCAVKGSWSSWEFTFSKDSAEFAHVTKKWAGIGKELFTSADNYMLTIGEQVPQNHPLRMLIMAAVMCIDMVLKE